MTSPASPALEALLDAVEILLMGASWWPDTDFGTAEMLVSSDDVRACQQALDAFLDAVNQKGDGCE